MPERVWDFDDFGSWRSMVWDMTGDILNEDVREAFLKSPPRFIVSDELGWLDDIVLAATDRQVNTQHLMIEKLTERFDAVRCCHATNTADVGTYYERGILPLDLERANQAVRAVYLDGSFPELSPEEVERAIAAADPEQRVGKAYFEANEWSLVHKCGHYLLNGSEYVASIARNLSGPGRRDYRRILRERGKPTMFLCDVPLGWLRMTIVEAAGTVLENMFKELLEGPDFEPDRYRGFGFSIPWALPPERIVGHYHLANVRDPHARDR
ncbi:hypothetical protein [Pseudoroseomonas sp. WGS1072]|uniref:hypothetical protein n=1 Tax=Roseomonas sp. WGS1072 TaxID=3366816 RepID=UPI003BF208A8